MNASSPTVLIKFTAYPREGMTWFLEQLPFRSVQRDVDKAKLEEVIREAHAEYIYRSQFSRDLQRAIDSVRLVLDCLPECNLRLRRLLRRSTNVKEARLSGEADVQDLVYMMLRPTFRDIVPEHSGSGGNPPETSRIDFVVHQGKIGIECKYIRENTSRAEIHRQLEEDKRLYKKCFSRMNMLFFLLYDPAQSLAEFGSLRDSISETVLLVDRAFRVNVLWYV